MAFSETFSNRSFLPGTPPYKATTASAVMDKKKIVNKSLRDFADKKPVILLLTFYIISILIIFISLVFYAVIN